MDTTKSYTNPNANYFTSGATFDTALSTPAIPTTINSQVTTPTQPLNLAPTPQDTTNYGATMAGVPDYNELLKSYATPTAQETATTASKTRTQQIMDAILGRGGSVGQSGQINTDIAKNTATETALQNFGYQGSSDAYKQLTDVTNQINALKKESLAIPLQLQEQAQGRGITTGGLAPIQTGQLRQNAIKSLGLSSIAETIQGNISTASALAERAVNMEFAPLQAQLNAEMFNYQQNKDLLDREDKKKSDLLNLQLQERQRLLNNQQEDKKIIYGWAAEAAKNGAPALLVARAQQSTNPADALSQLSQYMNDPMAKEKAIADINYTRAQTEVANANAAKIRAEDPKAPEVKTINGVDMQWNPKTQKWENISVGPNPSSNNVIDKITFLKQTANDALTVAGASGRSGLRKGIESTVVGATDYTKLVSLANTLKTNALTLATDPNIKKFFGPNMSNNDVQLMMSAGTTLNPDLQKPEDLKLEVNRLLRVFDKLENVAKQTNTPTVTVQGQSFIIGQVYEDAKGNRGSFDSSGKWIPQ